MFRFSLRSTVVAGLGTLAIAPAVRAQGIATDQLIESINVTALRLPSRGDVPGATASQTAAQLFWGDLLRALSRKTIHSRDCHAPLSSSVATL
jgi:hypothetical protein